MTQIAFPGVNRQVIWPDEVPAWERPVRCTGAAAPGARALMAYWLESYESIASSLGIYNCRSVRGGTTTSAHGEGRATDLAIPVTAEGHEVMYEFLRRLAPHVRRLGICYQIFNRVQWSAVRDRDGEEYRGAHPHTNHAHVELTRNAAEKLTLATLRAVVGDFRVDEPDEPEEEPEPSDDPEEILDMLPLLNLSKVRRGAGSTYVRAPREIVRSLQGLLAARGDYNGRLDGVAGPLTKAAVGNIQRRTNSGDGRGNADYLVGPNTWKAAHGL